MEFRTRIFENIKTASSDDVVFEAAKNKVLPSISYGHLRQFLASIKNSEIGSANVIGVYCNRTTEAYLAVITAFFLGKKFVPLNPKFPESKLKKIIELSGIDLIFTAGSPSKLPNFSVATLNISEIFFNLIGPEKPEIFDIVEIEETDFVYHLFTSGSTGDPKGVPITFNQLHHYVTGISNLVSFGTGKKFSQLFDLSFDLSMHDIFVCLYNQGTLIAASDFDLLLPVKYVEKNQIDHWFSVPVLAEVAVRNFDKQPTDHPLKTALFCGEALPVSTALNFRRCFKPDIAWNLYGPTEATIAFTARRIEPLQVDVNVFTLGEPFGVNKTGIELDTGDIVTEFKNGIEGEFLLGGKQVFSGYLPDVKAECFVNDSQETYYRSGDLVRIVENEICFVGRKDSQVKIRGHRVELGEIESAFRNITQLDLVVAFVTGDVFSPEISLAYQAATAADVLEKLKQVLPSYMLPKRILHFTKLPVNANGKIDRKKLAASLNG